MTRPKTAAKCSLHQEKNVARRLSRPENAACLISRRKWRVESDAQVGVPHGAPRCSVELAVNPIEYSSSVRLRRGACRRVG